MNDQAIAAPVSHLERTNRLKFIWGLVCLIGPIALIIVTLILYAVINFVASQQAAPAGSSELFDSPPSPTQAVGNIILFLVGAFSVMTFVPGIIVGIILLATRQKS